MANFADAISSIESGGNYGALGPVMKKSGDRAYGKYQVMGQNVGPWSLAALGRQMSPDEFLKDPQAQDAVFNHRFGSYVDKTGNPQDAAAMWFSGRPLAQSANNSDGYINTKQYVDRFSKALGYAPTKANEDDGEEDAPAKAEGVSAINAAFKKANDDEGEDGGDTPAAAQPTEGQQAQAPQAPPGLLDKLDQSGIGNSMQQAGAWLQSINNPNALNALPGLKAQLKGKDPQIDAKRGVAYVTGPDGQVRAVPIPGAKPDDDENNKKLVTTGVGPDGQRTFGVWDPKKATLNGQPVGAGAQAQGGVDPNAIVTNKEIPTGAEYEKTIPSDRVTTAHAMIEGRLPVPSPYAMKSPQVIQMLKDAVQIDPTFDATKWSGRVAAQKDWIGGGKSQEMVRSHNQVGQHIGGLIGDIDKLDNYQSPMANKVKNWWQSDVLGEAKVNPFLANAHAVADEMASAFKSARISDTEIKAWEKTLNENMSPEQQKAAVAKLRDLLHGGLNALEQKRRTALGPVAAEKLGSVIDPETQQVFDKIDEWAKPKQPAKAAAPQSGRPPLSSFSR